MMFGDCSTWAGSDDSYHAVMAAVASVSERIAGGHELPDREEGEPRLLSVDADSGVATIAISGSLVNSDSPFLEWLGMTGYPEIREALVSATENPNVKRILLDINSPGGAVNGVSDLAEFIRKVDKVKPVTAFSESLAASAGYWLAASARKVYGAKIATFGSIGVLVVHREYSEANKAGGVGVTVVRAGKEKALVNPHEKLSDKGREQIEDGLQAVYSTFVEHVATSRGKTEAYVRSHMAEGKLFIGEAAVDAGLIDGVSTFDKVYSTLVKQALDARSSGSNTSGRFAATAQNYSVEGDNSMSKKRTLTEQQMAALSAGIDMSDETLADDGVPEAVASETVEAGGEAADADAVENAGTQVETVKVDVAAMTAKIALLEEQLASANSQLLKANVDAARTGEKLDGALAQLAPLNKIVSTAVNNMRIACNMSAIDFSAMSSEQVLREHETAAMSFKKLIPVGGVASVEAEEAADKNTGYKLDNVTAARMRAIHGKL